VLVNCAEVIAVGPENKGLMPSRVKNQGLTDLGVRLEAYCSGLLVPVALH
jgi:hypothetical protein